MRRCVLLAAAIATATPIAVANPRVTGTPFITLWRADDYGGSAENSCIIQHLQSGLMYVGNRSGVLEFDGARWRTISVPGGAAVVALCGDARGRVWGATNAVIFRLDPDARGQLQARSMHGRLPAGFRPQRILGQCVATPTGVHFFDTKNLISFGLDDTPARTWRVAEGLVVAIRLWEIGGEPHVMIGGNVTFRVRRGNLERVPGLNTTVFDARSEPDGSWRILTTYTTERWDGQARKELGRLPAGDGAFRARFLADGRGVFATGRHGLVVCDPAGRVLQTIGRAKGLPANHVVDVIEDREGGVWAVCHNAIARVQLDSPYTLHGPAQGLDGTVFSLTRHGERLFTGGTEGVAERRADGQFRHLPDVSTVVREVVAHDERVFILTSRFRSLRPGVDREAAQLENRNYHGLLPMAGFPGWYVHGANEGIRWARFENGKWITQGPLAAIRGGAIARLESPAGVVWAAAAGGVCRIDFRGGLKPDAPTRLFGSKDGLSGQPAAMFLLGGQIVALAQGRLVRFDNAAQRFEPETRISGLESLRGPESKPQPIAAAHAGGDGTIWLQVGPPTGGIARLESLGPGRWRAEQLAGEPLRRLSPTALYHEADTRTLWVGGSGALVAYDLTWQPTRQPAPPVTLVRRMETASGEPLFGWWSTPASARTAPPALRLAPEHDAVRIHFAAPRFAPDHTGATHTEFRTRLDGLDDDWLPWSSQPTRDLTSLPWRAFTFRVQARDEAGRIGPEATLAFSIAPAWWATSWAWAGYGAVGLAGLAGIVRLRTRALQRRAARLERIVADRTRELAASNAQLATQNTELARLHQLELDEKIAAQLSEEKARLELLRYQLNPHFLLNAFTTLRSLVFSSPEAAGRTVERLADFCRLALTRSDESGATVDDEVRLIESYLDTEKARWRDELHVELQIDPAARPLPMPPFLLQPLIENAIKYGGRTSPGTLRIRASITRVGDALEIEIANTGAWVGPDSPLRHGSTGIGFENLRQRLRRTYHDAHAFTTEARDGWVYVRLSLPPATRKGLAAPEPARKDMTLV